MDQDDKSTEVSVQQLTKTSVDDFTVLSNVPQVLKERKKVRNDSDLVDFTGLMLVYFFNRVNRYNMILNLIQVTKYVRPEVRGIRVNQTLVPSLLRFSNCFKLLLQG